MNALTAAFRSTITPRSTGSSCRLGLMTIGGWKRQGGAGTKCSTATLSKRLSSKPSPRSSAALARGERHAVVDELANLFVAVAGDRPALNLGRIGPPSIGLAVVEDADGHGYPKYLERLFFGQAYVLAEPLANEAWADRGAVVERERERRATGRLEAAVRAALADDLVVQRSRIRTASKSRAFIDGKSVTSQWPRGCGGPRRGRVGRSPPRAPLGPRRCDRLAGRA